MPTSISRIPRVRHVCINFVTYPPLIFILLFSVLAGSVSAQEASVNSTGTQAREIEFRPQYALRYPSFRASARLIGPRHVVQGKKFVIEYRFFNNSGGAFFYNPFFGPLLWHQPAKLAVFDIEENYLGDLFAKEGGSVRMPGENDWPFIPGGSYVGGQRKFTAGIIPLTRFDKKHPLPPGKYRMQLVYSERIMVQRNANHLLHKRDREAFRSNAVEFDLYPAPAVAEKAP